MPPFSNIEECALRPGSLVSELRRQSIRSSETWLRVIMYIEHTHEGH